LTAEIRPLPNAHWLRWLTTGAGLLLAHLLPGATSGTVLPAAAQYQRHPVTLSAASGLASAVEAGRDGDRKSMAAAPPSARLHYEVAGQSQGLPFRADGLLDWQQDGRNYQARMEVSAFLVGSRSQRSSGRIDSQGLRPERFSDRGHREKTILFDHAGGQARHEPDGTVLDMPPGTQDRLSIFLQLALQMAALGHEPKTGDHWAMPVAGRRAIEPWTFGWCGIEALALPAGRIVTWHLQRQELQKGETQVDVWLAPELGFMPARLRLRQENGDSIDQRLLRR
jgi:Protein of unknown function (DUF3108)